MSASWTWSLALIALTTAVHSFGIVMLSLIGVRVHAYLKGQRLHFWQAVMILTVLIAAIGLSLAVLHGLEAAVWAGAYLWLGASDTLVQALLFSVDSMTTRGASGLVLHQRWQFMGALEAVAGMLMFGISTAYFFRYCCFTGPTYKPSGNAMKSARTLDSDCSFQFEAYVDLIAAAAALAALARALG